MAPTQPRSVAEFLSVRHQLALAGNTAQLEQLDDRLRDMAESNPDQTAAILIALSHSSDLGAKEAAAIYVRYLFQTRRDQAIEILLVLIYDDDIDVKSATLTTIDKVTQVPLTPEEAARLTTQLKIDQDTTR